MAENQQAPEVRDPACLPIAQPPALLVVVDTEEEFDWTAPLNRANVGVTAMREVHRLQELFEAYGLVPTYVVDYPVATQDDGIAPIRTFVESKRALVGTQLHPWVSPPFDEELTRSNSFPGNLPRALECAKVRALTDAITTNIGVRPTIYKAGRYGFGPNTAAVLDDLGYEVDMSSTPPFDYSDEGGPDYTGFSNEAFWFGPQARLLGIPNTGGYTGWLRSGGHTLHKMLEAPLAASLHAGGVLACMRAFSRIRLSPEGFTLADLKWLTRTHLAANGRLFTFSLHSPSAKPGCTPYVRSAAELTSFLDTCRRYVEWFLEDLGGVGTTPVALRSQLAAARHDGAVSSGIVRSPADQTG